MTIAGSCTRPGLVRGRLATSLLTGWFSMVLIGQGSCEKHRARDIGSGIDNGAHTPGSIPTYSEDGRRPIAELHHAYRALVRDHGWSVETIHRQTDTVTDGDGERALELPLLGFKTAHDGAALWIISGIHGEEPAGPNAIAANIEAIAALAEQGVPIVLLPLCNPKGYRNNWRYPNTPERDWRKGGYSVGDSEYLLPDLQTGSRARAEGAVGPDTAALTAWVLETAARHRPVMVIDHHEDEQLEGGYIYSQGMLAGKNPVAKQIIRILFESGIAIELEGKTRFGEQIVDGVVSSDDKGQRIRDGSIDELLASAKLIVDGREQAGPAAKTVIVVETPTRGVPLAKRVDAHGAVIRALGELWSAGKALEK